MFETTNIHQDPLPLLCRAADSKASGMGETRRLDCQDGRAMQRNMKRTYVSHVLHITTLSTNTHGRHASNTHLTDSHMDTIEIN